MKNTFKILSLVVSVALLGGCIEKEFDLNHLSSEIEYDPHLALTLGTMDITLEDLLKNYTSKDNIQTNDDGSITVLIEKNLQSYRADQTLQLPDQPVIYIPGFIFPSTMPASGSVTRDTLIPISVDFFADARIDSMLVKSLNYFLSGTSTFASNLSQELKISLLDMKKGNQEYSETYSLNSYINVNNANTAENYKLKFNNISDGKADTRLSIQFTLKGAAGSPIDPLSYLSLALKINQLNYHTLYGYIGQPYLLNFTDTFYLDFLNREMAKNIEWYNPKLAFYTQNSYVLPTDFFVESMQMITYDNKLISTNPDNTKIQNPKNIAYPSKYGETAYDSIICDRIGYNAAYNALNTQAPQKIVIKIKSKANPGGNIVQNVVGDTSSIKTRMVLSLPLNLRSSGFGYTDTMDFDIANLMSVNDSSNNVNVSVKTMLFRVISNNQLPIDMTLQAYFVDENYNVLDSLYKGKGNNYIIKSGTIDETTGRITSTKLYKQDFNFDEAQLDAIQDTKYLIYKVKMATTDYNTSMSFVKFFIDSKLKLSFAVKFQPSIHIYK
jgi:hypothetical protein